MYSRNLKFCSVLTISSVLLGCGKYLATEDIFQTERQAALHFFKSNTELLKSLTKEQEVLGYVLKCKEGYRVTTPFVGELMNTRYESDNPLKHCKISAGLHTHPIADKGWTMDFFSEADIKTSYVWRSYLLAQENCNIRFGYKLKDRYGKVIGKLKECK